jgi:hypothetical protein
MTLAEPEFTGSDVAMPWERVKTCYDGPATHLALCKLFHYLADRYFEVFEVTDESGYWAHNDDARFETWLGETTHNMQQFEEEMATLEEDDSHSPKELKERMYKLVREFGDKLKAPSNSE